MGSITTFMRLKHACQNYTAPSFFVSCTQQSQLFVSFAYALQHFLSLQTNSHCWHPKCNRMRTSSLIADIHITMNVTNLEVKRVMRLMGKGLNHAVMSSSSVKKAPNSTFCIPPLMQPWFGITCAKISIWHKFKTKKATHGLKRR